MWYLWKVESSCEQFSPVSTCLCPKYIKCSFQNLENVREDKNGRRWTILILIMKNKFSVYFAKINLFLIFETKSSLSTSFFILTISQILKNKFYFISTETYRNQKTVKFANFLNITCPLRQYNKMEFILKAPLLFQSILVPTWS